MFIPLLMHLSLCGMQRGEVHEVESLSRRRDFEREGLRTDYLLEWREHKLGQPSGKLPRMSNICVQVYLLFRPHP